MKSSFKRYLVASWRDVRVLFREFRVSLLLFVGVLLVGTIILDGLYVSPRNGRGLSFSEALANELQGTGVTVTCLCPGLARTEFHLRARMESSRVAKRRMMDAAAVAEAGYEGLMKGKLIVVPGLEFKFGPWFARLAPRGLVTRVVRSQHEAA